MDFFIPLIVWIGGFGWLSRRFKDRIADWVIRRSRLPRYLNYVLLSSPLILVEEFLTCETPFLSCIQTTYPAFQIMLLGLYIIWKLAGLKPGYAALLFGLWGSFNEMILVGRHYELPMATSLLFWILVIPIYAIVAYIPISYAYKASRDKILYIIPGWEDNCEDQAYQFLTRAAQEKGYKVVCKNVDWKKPLSIQAFSVPENATVFGFSLGALLAWLIAQKHPCRRLILASMTPHYSFSDPKIRQDLVDLAGKEFIDDIINHLRPTHQAEQQVTVYGGTRRRICGYTYSSHRP